MVATGRYETTFTTPSERTIEMTRMFDAPPALVFDAWTKPEQLAQWWGPRGFVNTVCEIDLRPGGKYRIVQHDIEGNEHPFKGEFREISRPGLLVYTMVYDVEPWSGDEEVVTMTLEDRGGKTFLRSVSSFASREARDAMLQSGAEGGARESYDRLAEHLQGVASSGAAHRRLVINRVFEAPREVVFAAWTDASQMSRWWGPHGFTNAVCESDPRSGGAIHIVMKGPDGTEYAMKGVYRELVPPERLVTASSALESEDRSAALEVLTTVIFVEDAARTRLTMEAVVLRATEAAAEALAGMNEGWSDSLERLGWILDAEASGALSGREIVQTRVFDAPRDVVFRAWTDAEQIGRWWGPNGFTTTTHEIDIRPGGTWRFVMHGPDGTDYDNTITYREIVPPERLSYRHSGGDEPGQFETMVTFEEQGSKTLLTMRAVFATLEERDLVVRDFNAIEGGRQTLARLADYVERR